MKTLEDYIQHLMNNGWLERCTAKQLARWVTLASKAFRAPEA